MDIAKMEVSSGVYQAQLNRMDQAGGAQRAAGAYEAKAAAQGLQTQDTVSISPEGALRAAALATAVIAGAPACEQSEA